MTPSTSSSPALLSTPLIGSDAIDRKDAPVGSFKYYALCGMGGALACGLTTSLYPKEIVVVMDPSKVPRTNQMVGVRGTAEVRRATVTQRNTEFVITQSISRCLKKGVAKFGFYDGFKDLYAKMAGDAAHAWRIPIFWFSAFSAQIFASAFYTDPTKLVSVDTNGKTLSLVEFDLRNRDQLTRLFPHHLRRRRNAMIQFPCYELATEALYGLFKPKADCSKSEQLAVAFTAGCIAGFACARITHSKDTRPPRSLGDRFPYAAAAEQLTLASRSVRMTALVAAQWTIYEGFKIATGISNQPTRYSVKSRENTETMPESLRKKLEESKLKKMKEQKSPDLQYPLTDLPMDPSTSPTSALPSTPLIRKEEKSKIYVPSLRL